MTFRQAFLLSPQFFSWTYISSTSIFSSFPMENVFSSSFWLQLRDSWHFFLICIEIPDSVSGNTHINQQRLTFSSCCLDLFPRPSHYFSFHLYCSPPSPSWSSSSTLPLEIPLTIFSIPHVGKRKCLSVNGSKCKSLVFTTVELSNPHQSGINMSICLGIMLKNYHLE